LAVIGEQAVHLVGKVVAGDTAVANLPEQNTSSIGFIGWQPDIQEDAVVGHFGGRGDLATRNFQICALVSNEISYLL